MNKQINISIIDYGMGNLSSIINIFSHFRCNVRIASDYSEFKNSDAIILPGVGAFGQAMKNLNNLNLIDDLKKIIIDKQIPTLGICLGMQLLADSSEENGFNQGLGLIPGRVEKIEVSQNLNLPHVGWNSIFKKEDNILFNNISNQSCFYFVHSFQYICESKYVIATTDYEKDIIAAIRLDNIFGVQFHPERSQSNGLKLIKNFLNLINERIKIN